MKTRVDRLLINDEEKGIQRSISVRCEDGNLKRKRIKTAIRDGELIPTAGVVVLLGEVLAENERLIARLKSTEDALGTVTEIVEDQNNSIEYVRDMAESIVAVLGGPSEDIEPDCE